MTVKITKGNSALYCDRGMKTSGKHQAWLVVNGMTVFPAGEEIDWGENRNCDGLENNRGRRLEW